MSIPHIVLRLATGSLSALATMSAAACFFPFQTPAEAQSVAPDTSGVTVDPGGKLLHRAPVIYSGPEKGTVVVSATINLEGEVVDARVLTGPNALRKPALESVLQWHYSPEMGTSANVQITIQFPPCPRAETVSMPGSPQPAPVRDSQPVIATLKKIEFRSVPEELAQRVRERFPLHEGDSIRTANDISEAFAAAHVRDLDEHLDVDQQWAGTGDNRTAAVYFVLRDAPPVGEPPPSHNPFRGPVPVYDGTQPAPLNWTRAGGFVAHLISKVNPVYPPLAKAAGVQGTVRFTAIIGKDGTVQNLQLVTGHPLLVPAALEAAKQWVFTPTLLDGQPVEIIAQIDVRFTLTQ